MNRRAVLVAKDFLALKKTALELMEEARSAPERERIMRLARGASNAGEVAALVSCTKRSFAEGYYDRVGYLLELESYLALQMRQDLDMDELRGLVAIAGARAEFARTHPPCSGCGKQLENEWDKTCNDCQRAAAAVGRGN
jgi:NADH pyrophosphatase NudC (nudix superfamily)